MGFIIFCTRDLHAGRVDPTRYRGLVFPGHDEYWSAPMRRTVERARNHGTSLVFLSANTMYWQVELAPSPSGVEDRLLTADRDPHVPLQQPAEVAEVLHDDRLIEAKPRADFLELLGGGALALRIHDLHRVTRHEMDEQRHRDGGEKDQSAIHRSLDPRISAGLHRRLKLDHA